MFWAGLGVGAVVGVILTIAVLFFLIMTRMGNE